MGEINSCSLAESQLTNQQGENERTSSKKKKGEKIGRAKTLRVRSG